jgi:hypothetical protein
MKDLTTYILTNKGKGISKWLHYPAIYEKHFSRFIGKKITMWEIGVDKGGSLQMWKDYFGDKATIVGLDIVPEYKNYKYEDSKIQIRIGDQADTVYLQDVIDEFGVPDILLDDGGHTMDQMNITFDYIYPKMKLGSIYMVEDTHTCYWEEFDGGIINPETFTNRCKDFIDLINAHHTRGVIDPNEFTNTTFSMHIYDSIVCFEKDEIPQRECPMIGLWDRNSLIASGHLGVE